MLCQLRGQTRWSKNACYPVPNQTVAADPPTESPHQSIFSHESCEFKMKMQLILLLLYRYQILFIYLVPYFSFNLSTNSAYRTVACSAVRPSPTSCFQRLYLYLPYTIITISICSGGVGRVEEDIERMNQDGKIGSGDEGKKSMFDIPGCQTRQAWARPRKRFYRQFSRGHKAVFCQIY